MHFTTQQIASYHENGFVAGPRVLTDAQISALRKRFSEIVVTERFITSH